MKSRPRFCLRSATLVAAFSTLSALFASAAESRFALPATDDGLPGAGPLRRADWFQRIWIERRTAFAENAARDQGALVFLGDSITQGWGDHLGRSFPGLPAANRGIGGDTTRGVLLRLAEDVLPLNPRGVVLLIGTNDLEEGAAPEVITANLQLILAALKRHNPRLPILLCQVFPSSAEKKRSADAIKRLNELYVAAVKGDPQITVLETWRLFANANGDAKPEEFPDLLHPNAVGYAKWAAAIRPILATWGMVETEPDDFQPEAGFVSLFNGRDLTGWTIGGADLTGKVSSPDGRYAAINGRLVATTPPEGRRVQKLMTVQSYPQDFVLKLEFRATPYADSGIFLRDRQLQCRDYPLAGPYRELKHYRPQEWNEVVVTVRNGVAHCTCNGEVLEAEYKLPETGPFGLEGDRGQMEYRRIRVQVLP